MSILTFKTAGSLKFGVGALGDLPEAIRAHSARSILLVTDAGLVQTGIPARIEELLRANDLDVATFSGVEPDPRVEIVEQGVSAARDAGAEAIVGVGGGSSLDIAKVVAIMLSNGGEPLDYAGIGHIPQPGLPMIAIPTTAGTGSEVTPIAVLSDKAAHLKKGIVSDYLYPTAALVDPELMAGLPPSVTAYTGIDALTHCIEAYTNRFAQAFVDTFALEGIRLAGKSLRTAVHRGADLDARSDMALASLYGGLCLGPVNTAAVHALAYPLGGTFDVPHGVANSLLLPYVMEFNLPSHLEKYHHVAVALGEKTAGLSLREAAQKSVSAVAQLSDDVGLVRRLRDLDIPQDAIPEMAENAMKVTRLLNNNPRPLKQADAEAIYRAAW